MSEPNFLLSLACFEADRQQWIDEIEGAKEEPGVGRVLHPWLDCPFRVIVDDHYANILSLISDSLRRGLQITQWAPDAKGNDFEAWIATFGDPAYPDEEIKYLQIHCKLTSPNLLVVRKLAKAWLLDGLPISDIERMIHG